MEATIVEDSLSGYDLVVTYNGTRFVAVARDEHGIALKAIYQFGKWELHTVNRPIPLRLLVARINEWLARYVRKPLEMPDEYPAMMPVFS